MTISWQWRSTRDSNSCPFKFFSIENSNIVKVTWLQLSPLPKPSTPLGFLIKMESSLDDHVGVYLDRSMSRTRWGQRAITFWLCPSHNFEIQNVEIVKVFFSIGASKNKYLRLSYKDSWMSISGWWGTNSLWSLEPGHGDWIQGVEISENFTFCSPTPENHYLGASQHGWMAVPWCWRSSWNFGFLSRIKSTVNLFALTSNT